MRRISLIGLMLAAGCTASPLPEAPFEGDFEFQPGTGSVPFRSLAGVVEPDQRLRLWVLNTMDPAITFSPQADGSVEGMIPAEATRVRLEILEGGRRSLPLDVNVADGSRVTRAGCVRLTSQIELRDEGEHLLRFDNDCAATLTLAFRLRAPAPITFPADVSVSAGETYNIAVSAVSGVEELLLIDLDGAATETRAITVFTR